MNEHTMTLIDSVRQYLVTEEKNKKIYHLPLDIAIRFDLAKVRSITPKPRLILSLICRIACFRWNSKAAVFFIILLVF